LQTPPHVPENDDDDLDMADKNSDEDDKQSFPTILLWPRT